MIFERIESAGIAHYSYLIGDDTEAVVIDPRRDCDIYLEKTIPSGYRIRHIIETHRNEDYVIGSRDLAEKTEAEIWHADSQLPYKYGQSVTDGQTWKFGSFVLEAIHTPGHTPGSMSYLLHDTTGAPWVLFTGDALFAGDVGRVDLMGMDHAAEMAGQLYDSIFNKILPLGDGTIVCPAHGTGSACGSEIASRPWTTIGIEQRTNPRLQYADRAEFVKHVAHEMPRPPYFRKMEDFNVNGAPPLPYLPLPQPLNADEFAREMGACQLLDTRMELGFSTAHVPNALSIWQDGVPKFAGWFLDYDKPVMLINETDDPETISRYLLRIGFHELPGYLSGGMLAWHKAGKTSRSIKTVTVQQLCDLLDRGGEPWILDVRSPGEITQSGKIPDAHNIDILGITSGLDRIPKDRAIYVFCGSGLRSMIAASALQSQGWTDIVVILGGLSGWTSFSCPLP
jgi:hydroxyacylglutathione hydrolase